MLSEPLLAIDSNDLNQLQPDGWSSLIPVFQYYTSNSFCIPLKICNDGKIVAIGTTILFNDTAWLAHVIVHPQYRNQGLGQIMVTELLNKTKEAGCKTVSLIATELGYPVYKKLGFEEEIDYIFFENSNIVDGGSISENINCFTSEDEEQLLVLDKLVSNEARGKIITNKIDGTYVYKEKNKLRGFYIPYLGEGLIVADNSEAGIELLKCKSLTVNKTVLPNSNEAGIKYLIENGFTETKRAKRMVYGKRLDWHPDKLYSRIGGNFG